MYFYSPSTNGFYEAGFNRVMPDDVRPVTAERYAALSVAKFNGLEISADGNGDPVAVQPVYRAPKTIAQQRAELLEASALELARRWRSGFSVAIDGTVYWFHSDEFSLTQYLGLKDQARDLLADGGLMTDRLLIDGRSVEWSTMNGLSVVMTAQAAFDVVAASRLQQAKIFAASQAHKEAINVAADLANYDVTANWPTVFGE